MAGLCAAARAHRARHRRRQRVRRAASIAYHLAAAASIGTLAAMVLGAFR